jgi:hypothetical protein
MRRSNQGRPEASDSLDTLLLKKDALTAIVERMI